MPETEIASYMCAHFELLFDISTMKSVSTVKQKEGNANSKN